MGLLVLVLQININRKIIEPPHDKTNNVVVCPAKTQSSLGICLVWSVFAVRSVGS